MENLRLVGTPNNRESGKGLVTVTFHPVAWLLLLLRLPSFVDFSILCAVLPLWVSLKVLIQRRRINQDGVQVD
jgi:hypothetical protein